MLQHIKGRGGEGTKRGAIVIRSFIQDNKREWKGDIIVKMG